MNIAGVGTDLARVERFRRFLSKEKLGIVERIFTPEEREYSLGKKDPSPHLAARFAAKEAFLKAIGLGLREGISWQDMSVERNELGKPSLKLSGRAAEIFQARGFQALHLSYSHDGDYAVATVIVEG